MEFLKDIRLIQGGMGVYVSNWRLARAVAMARPGQTVGTVSGTALDVVYVRLLQLGDPGGHARRALAAFDAQFATSVGKRICDEYFIEGGKAPHDRFKSAPLQVIRAPNGRGPLHIPAGTTSVAITLDEEIIELLIATGFAEVWLAKEGHTGNIFMNFLHKIEMPLIYILYGAMLAGVDGVIVGAGNPDGLPATAARLAVHEPVSKKLTVLYQEVGEEFRIGFDPKRICGGAFTKQPLKRPAFLAIASLDDLVTALAESQSGPPDGFIIEHHTAGGHNANPSGPLKKDDLGQPIYSPKDEPDLDAIRDVGRPFWLAGGYGSSEGLQRALAQGAAGVQVGSAFALAEDSGLWAPYRSAILDKLRNGADDDTLVRTTLYSPTGFSFKVAQIETTLADPEVFEQRHRLCDIGLLQQLGLTKPNGDGSRQIFQRCPAGPIEGYVNKRGLERNTEDKRCLCNGLLACAGFGQTHHTHGTLYEEPAIVTLGNDLTGIRRLSRQGQTNYWAQDVVADIMG